MKMPSFRDVIEVVNPWSETRGAFARMNEARHESDAVAKQEQRGTQIGSVDGSRVMAERPTFRHSDSDRPDFTKRVRLLLAGIIGNHPAFTKLDKFPEALSIDKQAEAVYERISEVLWGPGQKGREAGELMNIQQTSNEVLDENLRKTDDRHGALADNVRTMLNRDPQLHFMTEDQAAERDAEYWKRILATEEQMRQF